MGSVTKKSLFQNVPTFVIKMYLRFYNKRGYVLKRTISCNRPQGEHCKGGPLKRNRNNRRTKVVGKNITFCLSPCEYLKRIGIAKNPGFSFKWPHKRKRQYGQYKSKATKFKSRNQTEWISETGLDFTRSLEERIPHNKSSWMCLSVY